MIKRNKDFTESATEFWLTSFLILFTNLAATAEPLSAEKFHELVYMDDGVSLPELINCSAVSLEAPALPIWCRVGGIEIHLENNVVNGVNLGEIFGEVSMDAIWTAVESDQTDMLPLKFLDWNFDVKETWSYSDDSRNVFCSFGGPSKEESGFGVPTLQTARCFQFIEGSYLNPGQRMLKTTFYDLGDLSLMGANTPTDLTLFKSVVVFVALTTRIELRSEK
ncbi:hypothetical protein [Tabrizicola aquatica]|uniref:hypothetical protein n=1 Tax=Tabrizicola aquatica TaxID=909926 RepID=UPI0011AF3830|nr:hypothetical protein [Tabrizicola aquatica]